jgi:hypothetical protein
MQYSAVDYLAGSAAPGALRANCPLQPHGFTELRKRTRVAWPCITKHINSTQDSRFPSQIALFAQLTSVAPTGIQPLNSVWGGSGMRVEEGELQVIARRLGTVVGAR